MTNNDEVEQLFNIIDESTEILMKELDSSYLDALIETGDNLISGEVHIEDGKPSTSARHNLEHFYEETNIKQLNAEVVRQALQLAILNASQQDHIQANHQMTPDTIGMLFAYLLQELLADTKTLTVLDPAVGTGNLLTTIMNDIHQNHKETKISGIGIDNDDSMLAMADINSRLQNLDVDLFHQDALDQLVFNSADVAVSDLPVGYYPIDVRVKKYQTHSTEGHSYVHHLLIEQAMNHVVASGFGLFLVPTNIFQTDQAANLLNYCKNNIYLQGFLNLPKDLFTNASLQKSILIVQNYGTQAKQASKVLLGDFPSFKNQKEMKKFLDEIKQ
ncbi:class I SAM-dependent methyltransferase [Pediococcus damnosus]